MKNKILLVIIIGTIFWFTNQETMMDKLMDVDFPIVATEQSGILSYEPESGELVNIEDQLEDGLINIVYFHSSKCKGCLVFDKNIDQLMQVRPDIAVTKLPVEKTAYRPRYMGELPDIGGLPFVMIFDRNKELLISDNADEHIAFSMFYKWINKEINRKR